MFERIHLRLTRFAKHVKQRGQVSLLFAFLIPLFFLFLGVALDFGWYYLNVSRLQNAADSAAVAGAQTLIDSGDFPGYENVSPLLVGHYPGTVSNEYRASNSAVIGAITKSQDVAIKYASKNLSGSENNLFNSWTKNEVQSEEPVIYEKDDNLYFVVKLKDTIEHFFLRGWFNDMDAPVTSIAMISKNASAVAAAGNEASPKGGELPNNPSVPDMPEMDISIFPEMPNLPDSPNKIDEGFRKTLDLSKNKNAIVGNWEVQNYYKNRTDLEGSTGLTEFQARFGYTVYDKAWNHLQDLKNHYYVGDLYRKQTVNILDDVTTDGQVTANERKTYASKKFGGNGSSVRQTLAAKNSNESSTAYNPDGYPYLGERVDSLNIDFKPELIFKGDWLSEDWDLTLNNWEGVTVKTDMIDWGSANADAVKKLRIHSSLNFEEAYNARTNEEFLEKNKEGKVIKDINENVIDVLYVRIESEPMLHNPDLINSEAKSKYAPKVKATDGGIGITGLNSVNQIIININKPNDAVNKRPVVIFYDGPETNDVYCDEESEKKHVRDSLPVILNLNAPFRGVLYAPNSPVVIIGNAKDYFRGFVVAKKYMRLKDESDYKSDYESRPKYTNREDLSLYGLRTYYDSNGNSFYKITDENGIEMFVDARGDIQFADLPVAPTNYGKYDNFGRTEFTMEDYDILQTSPDNMLLSGK